MPNVQASARRIREHIQYIVFGLRTGIAYLIGLMFGPKGLPLLFYLPKLIIHLFRLLNCENSKNSSELEEKRLILIPKIACLKSAHKSLFSWSKNSITLEPHAQKKQNKTIRVSSIVSISLVLLMGGLLGLILVHSHNLSSYVKENIVLNVIVNEGTKEADILTFQTQVNTKVEVLRMQYVSKEQAARNLTKDLGEDFVDFLGYNPLLPALDIYLKAEFADNASIAKFAKDLEKNDLVKEVVYQKSLIDIVNHNVRLISIGILIFGLILLLIAITLINNTIRLAIYAQRFQLKSMQLVGATEDFILKPFLMSSVIQGLIAGLSSVGLLLVLLVLVKNQIPEIVALRDWVQFSLVFLSMILAGIIISALSTRFAVKRYLQTSSNELY